MKDKYQVLVPYVSHRYDLNYVIGEMIGELANSHTYVGGGDYPDIDQVNYGMLGIDLTTDNGYYRIAKIYPGDNTRESRTSPLTKPGIDVQEGSYILAIDGNPVRAGDNFYEHLENKAGKQVVLTVNSRPRENGARKVTVEPIESEYNLRHWHWINTNREKVSETSDGKIGYVYLTDMSATGLNEFVEQYYPQIRKQGLIIDVRYNGGGFVDQLVLERLRRVLIGMGMSRNGSRSTSPPQVFTGYMVSLINAYSASDGDIFPYLFRKYGLGELIGQRTWGGVRGIRGTPGIMDGGYIFPPEFSRYDLDSTWNMENYGVAPDIEVDNRPELVAEGQDPQLERAVEVLMKKIRENPENKHLELPGQPEFDPPFPEEYYEMLDIKPEEN
jgi:tricorn protease